jgi:acyl CoA:acetate/3-ketoacid CoA transferase alpha subunit
METEELKSFLDSKFRLPIVEGEDKVCSLDEAIRRHVKRGMSISFAGRGGALINQLVREFWDRNPEFTIINTGISATVLSLIHGRLAKKIARFSWVGLSSEIDYSFPQINIPGIESFAYNGSLRPELLKSP